MDEFEEFISNEHLNAPLYAEPRRPTVIEQHYYSEAFASFCPYDLEVNDERNVCECTDEQRQECAMNI